MIIIIIIFRTARNIACLLSGKYNATLTLQMWAVLFSVQFKVNKDIDKGWHLQNPRCPITAPNHKWPSAVHPGRPADRNTITRCIYQRVKCCQIVVWNLNIRWNINALQANDKIDGGAIYLRANLDGFKVGGQQKQHLVDLPSGIPNGMLFFFFFFFPDEPTEKQINKQAILELLCYSISDPKPYTTLTLNLYLKLLVHIWYCKVRTRPLWT